MSAPDSEEIFVEHEGHRIACIAHEFEGATRLPAVWIHGLTMSVRFWEKGMPNSLERDRSWYSISLPLHHPSTFDGELTDKTLYEELFAELLDAAIQELIPEEKFHLVGHSLGGFAALNYGAKFSDRVASITSIGGFMAGRAQGVEGILQFLSHGRFIRKALFFGAFKILKRHIFFLKIAAYSSTRKWKKMSRQSALSEMLELVYPDIKQHCIKAQRAICRYLLDMNLLDEFDDIELPVLVMIGENDPIIPSVHQIEYGIRLNRSKICLFDGAGHLPFAEDPEKFEKELAAWLERHDEAEKNTS